MSLKVAEPMHYSVIFPVYVKPSKLSSEILKLVMTRISQDIYVGVTVSEVFIGLSEVQL